MNSHPDRQTLDQIPKGRFARVVDVSGDDPIARRLGDLGVRVGVEIEIIRRAPLGDPTLFELCGYQLCLRRSESARVGVTAIDSRTQPIQQSASARSNGSPDIPDHP